MRRLVARLAAILPLLVTSIAGGLSGDKASTGALSGPIRTVAFSGPCGLLHAPAVGYQHVIWIWMENTSYEQVIGPPGSSAAAGAPYVNSLAAHCGLATNYHNITHPSLPNYLAATSGSTLGVTGDCLPTNCPQSAPNVFSQLTAAGLNWSEYAESMPAPCWRGDYGEYAARHNPPVYYTNVAGSCPYWDIPLGSMSSGPFISGLITGRLPTFVFVTPNLCDDMHDCPIGVGDAWLSHWVPLITASPAYKSGSTALFITWDEGLFGPSSDCATNTTDIGCHVATIAVTPSTAIGARATALTNHYSLLRTTEDLLGVGHLGHAGDAGTLSLASAFGLQDSGAAVSVAAAGTPSATTVLWRGPTGNLMAVSASGGAWSAPVNLGGFQRFGPALAVGSGHEDAFVTGSDWQVWTKWVTGGGWSGWAPLGGRAVSGPAAVASAGGRVDVFVRGTDAALWHAARVGGRWSGWSSLGGILASAPAVALTATGLVALVRGMDDQLWVRRSAGVGGAWSGWAAASGILTGAPAAVALGSQLPAVVRSLGGAAWSCEMGAGGCTRWQWMGGILASSPAVAPWGGGVAAYIIGTNGRLYQNIGSGATWAGWRLVP